MFKQSWFFILASVFICISAFGLSNERDSINWIKQSIYSFGTSKIEFNSRGLPIDSDSNEIISINRGRIAAYDRARESTIESIIQSIKNIRVDSDNRIIDIINENAITQSKLYDLINSNTRFKEYPINSFTAACKADLKINAIILALPFQYPMDEFPKREDNPVSTLYSSLIIDTRGLDVDPMIFPVVYNEDGLEVYSRNFISVKHAARRGMVSYTFSEKSAMKNRLAGHHPFFTVALKSHKGCPVLSNNDVKKLFSHNKTLDELRKCKVIFIIDHNKGQN